MEEKKKIRVLAVPSDEGGCKYWRVERPHLKLQEMFPDDFDVVIQNQVDWTNLDFINQFDIITVHKGLFGGNGLYDYRNAVNYCKKNNIVTIIDVDDYWHLGQFHPMDRQNKITKSPENTIQNLQMVDYVTTTTPLFANEIKKFNKNAFVFPNAVDTEDHQWDPDYSKSDLIRFGFVMGSSHERDMEQFVGVVNQLPKDIFEKIQIVLCGYDLRGTITMIGPDGQITGQRNITPEESVWYRYEKIVTDDYKVCDPQYTQFLKMFMPDAQYPGVETKHYRREWTKGLTSFGTHYNNLDVLMVPLDSNKFNYHKSELKIVEAGFKNKAIILSNYGPYTIGTKSIFKKGGDIDETGNCVLIDPLKAHKDWAKAIKRLVQKPELIDLLKKNLHDHVKDTYNLETVTKKRAEWYKSIVKR